MKLMLSRKSGMIVGLVGLAVVLVAFWAFTAKAQDVVFTQSMDIGSQGSQISALQTYLATKTPHYPEGLVTGYFGSLTQAAVQRFQCAEEIVCSGSPSTTGYGRVGPKTLLQLNLRASGTTSADISAPFIWGTSVAASSNSATVNFSTNEAATGKVYYSTTPLNLTEAVGIGFAPMISGNGTMTDSNFRTAHSIALSGLTANTTYYFAVQAVDASGNLSVTWPTTFRTNP